MISSPDVRRLWWAETRMLEIFASHGAELILLMQVQERGGGGGVVIISNAESLPWEDVNVWETNQFLVPSLLLMWFWRFISRCMAVTCSLVSETSEYMNSSAYPDLFNSRLLMHCFWQIYCAAGAHVSIHVWCKALCVLLKVYVSTKRCWY